MFDTLSVDKQFWTPQQTQQLDLFLSINPFFAPLYDPQDFHTLTSLLFYAKIAPQSQLVLSNAKKSQAVILLRGRVEVYKKLSLDTKTKRQLKRSKAKTVHQNYYYQAQHFHKNQVIAIQTDSVLINNQQTAAQIAYIPLKLYEEYKNAVKMRKTLRIVNLLISVFPGASKFALRALAEEGCVFHEQSIHHHIYKCGTVPEECYVLAQGTVQLEFSGGNHQNDLSNNNHNQSQRVIINSPKLFGQKDLNQQQRDHQAMCHSAHCRYLAIPRNAYNKFIAKNSYLNEPYAQKLRQLSGSRSKKILTQSPSPHKLPIMPSSSSRLPTLPPLLLPKIHSSMLPQQQQQFQKAILKNCHMLVNISPRKRRAQSSFRSPEHSQPGVSQFERKVQLFNKIKNSKPPLILQEGLGLL